MTQNTKSFTEKLNKFAEKELPRILKKRNKILIRLFKKGR